MDDPGPVAPVDVSGALMRLRIVSGAMILGVLAFCAVAVFLVLSGQLTADLPEGGLLLPGAFAAAAAVVLAAPRIGELAGKRVPGVPAEERIQAFFTQTVVTQAIREGTGLGGIALAMLAGEAGWVVAFATLSVLAQAWGWPKEDDLRRRLRGSGRGT